MRVTAGKYKGRILQNTGLANVRPTADKVKQALFNSLAFRISGAKVLDLFCGSGALGIEAISRGAQEVVFADKDARSVALTKRNLLTLGEKTRVIKASFEIALQSLKGEQFDIIILDPPYKAEYYLPALELISKLNLLADDGVIVCEHDKLDEIDSPHFELQNTKTYGIKALSYYVKKGE